MNTGLLSLVRGLAILRLDGGAEIVMKGETEIELLSRNDAKLVHGDITVRAVGDAAGFRLVTPVQELTDLGTEFAVKVDLSGATELQVLDGEVAYSPLDSAQDAEIANAGHALRFEAKDSMPRQVAFNAPRFSELVSEADPRERRDLMSVYEGFEYSEGSYSPASLSSGKGWAGPWRLRQESEWLGNEARDNTQDMSIATDKLTELSKVDGGQMGRLEMPKGTNHRVRSMSQPIDFSQNGITYFSLMTYDPTKTARSRSDSPREQVRLAFRSSAGFTGRFFSFGWGQRRRPQIQVGFGRRFVSPDSIPDEQALLWIGKIIARAKGEDELFFRVYGPTESLDYAEPANWTIHSDDLHLQGSFDLVELTSADVSPRFFDEIRIGPSWRSVVPMTSPIAAKDSEK